MFLLLSLFLLLFPPSCFTFRASTAVMLHSRYDEAVAQFETVHDVYSEFQVVRVILKDLLNIIRDEEQWEFIPLIENRLESMKDGLRYLRG